MRIFRMKPNISAILSRCDSKEEKKFISHVANSCFKRFMNISKMEKEIHTQLTKSEINLQSKILGDFIHSLSSTPRGEEIARDMFVASARSIQKIDVEAALSFSEKLIDKIYSVAVIRRMIGLYLSRGDIKRANQLLETLPEDQWNHGTKKRIEEKLKLNASILAEKSDESKFFNILKPIKRDKSFPDLNVACLLDRFSFDCFSYEMNLIPVSKSNWRSILSRPDIDFFLAESIWSGHDGGWQFAMSSFDTAAGNQLKQLLSFCKEEGVKTIFWNKEDPVNYDSFIDVAKQFDYIFTSDSGQIPKYIHECGHDNVYSLPFAAQPIIHNPIRNNLPSHDVGFAGSWYIREHGNRKRDTKLLLDAASSHGLHIFDRFYGTDNRNKFPEEYNDFIKGSLSYKETCMAYRVYKLFLNVNSVSDSPTMFSRRVFEVLASASTLVSSPSRGMEEMLGDCLVVVDDHQIASETINNLLSDDFARKSIAHRGYREVMNNHTYFHRLKEIFSVSGINYANHESLLVSCICVSNRPHLIDDVIQKFDLQTYANKELVILLEADDAIFQNISDKIDKRDDIMLHRASEKEILGALFNRGVNLSHGEYIAKWDDDDLYGPEYLSDSLLGFKYSSASVVGKLESFMFHEGTNSLYTRFENKAFRYQQLILGPTIIAKRKVFDSIRFQERSRGEDTNFLKDCLKSGLKIFATDPYNFIYWRSADKTKHTWQPDDDELLKNAKKISSGLSTSEVFI